MNLHRDFLSGTANHLIIANAILWAACIVAFAWILQGTAESSLVTALLVACGFASVLILSLGLRGVDTSREIR